METYRRLEFPPSPPDRPYTFINMVTTIDGKSVVGTHEEDVVGLGSRVDFQLMTRIEASADAVLVGARTLRATGPRWSPAARLRVVVTASGDVPREAAFFDGDSVIASTSSAENSYLSKGDSWSFGEDSVDLSALLSWLRTERGVERLVVMGGSELNGQLLERSLVDELFLTIAPRVKLGRTTETYAGGTPFPRDKMPDFNLIEHHVHGDEVFLRYRRKIS